MIHRGSATVLCAFTVATLCVGEATADEPYDRDPQHPWNRLHRTLFVWDSPWEGSWNRHFLEKESHKRVIRVLDEFLEQKAAGLVVDPRKRLMLQRDLWAVFDLTFSGVEKGNELEAERRSLRERAARIIGAVALSDEEILKLPDNLERAVGSRKYRAEYDRGPVPFLPADLFDDKGPWVRIGGDPPLAVRHNDAVRGRSHFHVLLRIGDRREDALTYLKDLNANMRTVPAIDTRGALPDDSIVALVRRALAIDEQGRIRATPVIEGIQIRPKSLRDVTEFKQDASACFADAGGLIPVGDGEEGLPLTQSTELAARYGQPRSQAKPLLANCLGCHHSPEASQVHSFKRLVQASLASDPEPLKTLSMESELDVTIRWKQSRGEWKELRSALDALRKR